MAEVLGSATHSSQPLMEAGLDSLGASFCFTFTHLINSVQFPVKVLLYACRYRLHLVVASPQLMYVVRSVDVVLTTTRVLGRLQAL